MSSNTIFQGMTPLAFFDRYPVTRVGVQGAPVPVLSFADKVKKAILPKPPAPAPWVKGNPANAQGIVSKDRRVGYCTITHDASSPAQDISPNSDVPVKITFSEQGPGIPIFYLPYQDDYNYRTTLVDHQGLNASFFLTALIDGCSIYVEGTQAQPTVYHLNARSTVAPNLAPPTTPALQRAADWNAKYTLMDTRFRKDALKLTPGANGYRIPKRVKQMDANLLLPGKLENHNYMIGPAQAAAFEATLGALQAAGRAPTFLKGQPVDEMQLLAPQGTAFGAKAGGTWRFYVQRRAMVEYFHVPMGLPRVSLGRQWIVRDVIEFWPNATTGTQLASIW